MNAKLANLQPADLKTANLKPESLETATAAPSASERLVDQLANKIGGLGVELADVAGNVQEVAQRVSVQSDRFGHLQKTAETMVAANHNIAKKPVEHVVAKISKEWRCLDSMHMHQLILPIREPHAVQPWR